MSKLRQKSDFNIEAAEKLITSNLYAPSVHCSYYSCFQLFKFTIKDFLGFEYDELSNKISQSDRNTHVYIIGSVLDVIKKNEKDTILYTDLKRKIKDLKQYRLDSDYENIEVDQTKGDKAFKIAKEIRSYIINNFNV